MLTITAKNLGPLAEGTVDVKPLTIFVGPSNTGKSYMAAAIWAVMRAVEGRPQVPYIRNLLMRYGKPISSGSRWKAPDEVADAIREWVSQQEREAWESKEPTVSVMPEKVRSELVQSTHQVLELFCSDVIKQLHQTYGETSGFVSRRSKPEDFQIIIQRDEPLLNVDIHLTDIKKSVHDFDISQASVPSYMIEHWGLDYKLDEYINPDLYFDLFLGLRISAAENVLGGFPAQSFYLPAARSGIAQGHKVLAAALVRQSSQIGLEPLNIPTLPGITTDFLSNLISLDRSMGSRRSDDGDLQKAISFIENHVLHGGIHLEESGGMPFPEIVYLPVGVETHPQKFTLNHTSSMVSELAPVILFLKYLVNPGDLLIIEEPESHLHPAAQLQMARGIARLVNAGVNVLITTHSSDFTAQISNLLSMSNVSTQTVIELGLAREDCLAPDQVGAYGFRMDPGQNGSVIYPLPIGTDVGIEDQEFLPVAENLYEQAIALQNNRLK